MRKHNLKKGHLYVLRYPNNNVFARLTKRSENGRHKFRVITSEQPVGRSLTVYPYGVDGTFPVTVDPVAPGELARMYKCGCRAPVSEIRTLPGQTVPAHVATPVVAPPRIPDTDDRRPKTWIKQPKKARTENPNDIERAADIYERCGTSKFEQALEQTGVDVFDLRRELAKRGLRKQRKFGDPDMQRAVELYDLGAPYNDIAMRTGVSHAHMAAELRWRGIKPRRCPTKLVGIKGTPPHDVVRMFMSGMTMTDIAIKLGCTRGRVFSFLKRLGISRKDGGLHARKEKLRQAVVAAFKPGVDVKDIAETVGAGRVRVLAILHEEGLNPSRLAPLSNKEILKAMYKKSSASAIAREMHTTYGTVVKYLKKAGIRVRSTRRTGKKLKATPLYDRAWLKEQLETRTPKDIAEQFRVSIGTIINVKKRLGLIKRRRRTAPTPVYPLLRDRVWMTDQLVRLGRTRGSVAREIGCSVGTVQRVWKEMWKID